MGATLRNVEEINFLFLGCSCFNFGIWPPEPLDLTDEIAPIEINILILLQVVGSCLCIVDLCEPSYVLGYKLITYTQG